ncbi:MAG: GWxTD domain-containing protein [bacterium]|nr:GWxTD domain-containing protein [bacterium]
MRPILIICLMLFQSAWGEESKTVSPGISSQHAVSVGSLRFFSDTGVFRGPENGLMRLEVFLLLDAMQFNFVPDKGLLKAQFDLTVRATRAEGNAMAPSSWTRSLTIESPTKEGEGQAPYRDRVWMDLPPGNYELVVEVDDMFGDKKGKSQSWIHVYDFEQDGLIFSDIVLAGEIKSSENDGRFVRYNWEVVPNVTRRYLVEKDIPLYFELYNLKLSENPDRNSFVVEYSLTDSTGLAIKKFPPKRYLTVGTGAVQTMELSTEDIKPGVYWVQVAAFDRAGKRGANQRRRLVLASLKEPTPEMSDEDASQLRYYKDIRNVANAKELKQYEGLPESAQMNFLRQFWKAQDPTPGTPVNERLIQHLQRMNYVETHFSRSNREEPVDTDRGRVYIKYGPPDDIDRVSSSAEEKASEVWHYGRHQFIFRDSNGLGVYRLVHSTYPGEIYNPEWQLQTY